jgi:hypothetical protein
MPHVVYKSMKNKNTLIAILVLLLLIVVGLYFLNNKEKPIAIQNSGSFTLGTPEGVVWNFGEVGVLSLNGVTTPVWDYRLTIDQKDETKGTLSIDGYQTMVRHNVKIVQHNDSANVVFESYGDGNAFDTYKKGDILFTIAPLRDQNKLEIGWEKMQPNVEANKTNAFFTKI